ncbi:MAG: Nuclear speckle splicing regulatory protein 1, partial [Paramarteilia canceri]
YIENMKVASFRRQLENERHMERKLQRERQEEKEQNLSDVEEFVTSAYKAKLEEFSELNELEMLEAQNSKFSAVENQADVSAIHKYYMDQKYGTPSVEVKETQKCLANEDNESSEDEENNKSSEEEIKQSKNVPRKSKKVIIVEDDEESEEDRIAREKTIAVRKFGRRCIGEKFIEAQQAYLQRKSLDLVKPIVESE